MSIDLDKALKKGLNKKQLHQAFIAGGRYYLKTFGRGNIAKKDLGEILDFEEWYKKQEEK